MNLDANLLVPVVRSALDKADGARFLAIQSDAPPAEPFDFDVDGKRWQAVPVRSTLQARRAMVQAGEDGRRVLLTSVLETGLGEEVVARLAQRRVHRIEPWQLVRAAFQAQSLDPRVTRQAWMAEAFLAHLPPGGYSPVRSGILDLETAWAALTEIAGLPVGAWSPAGVLTACTEGELPRRWERLSAGFREGLRARLAERLGHLGQIVASLLERGQGDRAVGLGLIAAAADRAIATHSDRTKVLVRIEDQLGVTDGLGEWGAAAEAWCRSRIPEPGIEAIAWVLDQANDAARTLGAGPLLGHSSILRGGVDARMRTFAEALKQAIADHAVSDDRDAVERSADAVLDHMLLGADPAYGGFAGRVRAARRLVRWLGSTPAAPRSLAEHATAYRDEGAWVDRARYGLSRGSEGPEVRRTYAELGKKVCERREEGTRAFAQRLAAVTGDQEGAGDVRLLERLYREVVAPLARQAPVLVVVMDGMSQVVFQQLAQDAVKHSTMLRMAPAEEPTWRPLLTPLPTVTEVCRTSLLSGELTSGSANQERVGIEALAEEFGWRKGKQTIRALFHKGTVHEAGGGLSSEVREALESKHRVVTVVLNAVDDLLPKGDQLEPRWSLARIPELKALLAAAEIEQRCLVLTSDHGHVVELWEGEVEASHATEKGERWRAPGRPVGELEVEIRGSRVLLPEIGGTVVLPWSERLRYAARHAGYHGGASPQEVVVPLGVFVPVNLVESLDGWAAEIVETPWWWTGTEPVAVRAQVALAEPRAAKNSRQERGDHPGQRQAFAPPSPTGMAGRESWVQALLASEVYKAQKKAAARQRPDDDKIASLLEALEANGYAASFEGLRNRTRMIPMRFAGLLSLMQKLLNVDGYSVLQVNRTEERVQLDLALLRKQFGLTEGTV